MPDTLILTHGAGSNRDAPLLVALDAAFTAAGLKVVRMNLPSREAGLAGPPRAADQERDREGLRRAALEAGGRVYIGGHSYGGRQASMMASEHPDLLQGLLLMSYPLHPPRRPDQLRTAHLPQLRTPALFVHGARDPFGSLDELRPAIALIPARTSLLAFESVGHELAPRSKSGLSRATEAIVNGFVEFFGKE